MGVCRARELRDGICKLLIVKGFFLSQSGSKLLIYKDFLNSLFFLGSATHPLRRTQGAHRRGASVCESSEGHVRPVAQTAAGVAQTRFPQVTSTLRAPPPCR